MYGKPTRETMQRAERGEIKLGGCMVTDSDPNRYCRACKHRWIDTTDPWWIEREQLRQRLKKYRRGRGERPSQLN